jgi:MFS family permease
MLFADSLILVATAMLGPIYALFVERIGGDLLDAGITFGAFSFAAGIVTLISGTFTDRIKEAELIIVLGYVVTAIGFLSYVFVENMTALIFAQVVVGIGTAIRYPAFDAVFSSHLDKGEGGREWGAWESTLYFTSAFGAVMGGYLASEFGFDYIFVIMSVLSFAAAVYIYSLPRKLL